jgi:hypothetical protein
VKELVENYFVPKLRGNTRKCEKYYCKNCLRNIYDIDVTEIKKKISNVHHVQIDAFVQDASDMKI